MLPNYTSYAGRHPETGSIHNVLAHQGVTAPHTGQPYSEALLMGVSGGAVMGYFSFAYDGIDPILAILTRNTFNPLETLLSRLGIVQTAKQTTKADKGWQNMVDALEEGVPPIVWLDMFSLPYNAVKGGEQMWGMLPAVVVGVADETVYLADRAGVPLTVDRERFNAARGRVKKEKFRTLTVSPPNPDKLASAVEAGLVSCVQLFTEKPPKGAKHNFGFAAYEHWQKLLTKPKGRMSWANQFPFGRKWIAAAVGLIERTQGDGERNLYADFLDEAAIILQRPPLNDAAAHFRASAVEWGTLCATMLPERHAPLAELRQLLFERARLFIEEGNASTAERVAINQRIEALKDAAEEGRIDLTASDVAHIQAEMAEQIGKISALEQQAIAAIG